MKPLIIGFGNPLCSDDGVGWHAAEYLRTSYGPAQARVIAAHQLGPEMAEDVARASVVIFIDAEQGKPPGEVASRTLQPRSEAPRTFTHHLSPATLIACSRLLFRAAPPAFLVTVGASEFAAGEKLTAPVASALPRVAREVEHLLAGLPAARPASH